MLQPAKMKFRKRHKEPWRTRGKAHRGNTLAFGSFGLQALESGRLTQRQIEAGRIAIVRTVKRGGRLWVRLFPDKPMTKKPQESRMGKGKGNVEFWIAPIKAGRMIFELDGVSNEVAEQALSLAGKKMPVATRVVSKEALYEG